MLAGHNKCYTIPEQAAVRNPTCELIEIHLAATLFAA
jgi:hypothetical protein